MKKIKILDSTLRDGEQMPGVVFTKSQKISLAEKILDFGIDLIDIMPAVSRLETELTELLVEKGYSNNIVATTLLRKEHIDLASYCGVKNIALFTSVSDIHLDKKLFISREENLKRSLKFVDYSNDKGLKVYFAGEDSTRADINYLIHFINSMHDNIEYFFPCDTLGILTPRKTYNFIKRLKKETDCKIGLHVHNDFGCAVANTLSGIEAGAELFSGTFNGIGERAGNASIEELVTALKCQYKLRLPLNYRLLGGICRLVEKYSEVKLQSHKPISGENAFSHESGVHVDGIIKHSGNYENFEPGSIGRKRKILFGKHSGTCSLRYVFGERFSEKRYNEILDEIKYKSQKEKRSFSLKEVIAMYGGNL